MTGKDLKIFSMFYISEHENLSKTQKMDLYEFVQKADSFSVMNFLTTGQPVYIPNRHRKNVVESFVSTKVGGILTEQGGDPDRARKAQLADVHAAPGDNPELKQSRDFSAKAKELSQQGGDSEAKYASTPDYKEDTVKQAGLDIKNKGEEMAGQAQAWYKGGINALANKFAGADMAQTSEDSIAHSEKIAGIEKALNSGAAGLAATAVAAVVGYLGYKVYKNYFSKAARACKAAPDKKACMAKVRAGAITQAARTINSQKASCKKSADPAKCAAKLDAKLGKMRAKLGSLK